MKNIVVQNCFVSLLCKCIILDTNFTDLNTKRPVLKHDGQPQSGTADSSSRWNKSSIERTTTISASQKTIFSYWVNFHTCNFVNVTPSSGRLSSAKLAWSFESIISTVTSLSKATSSWKKNRILSLYKVLIIWLPVTETHRWCYS